jgi:hypothetical protein
LNLSAEVSQASSQLIEAVEFKLKAAGAHEIDTMWIELLVSGNVRLGTFTPHLVPVLDPVVWLLPVHDAQRCCEQVIRQTCLSSRFGMIGQRLPTADEPVRCIRDFFTPPGFGCKGLFSRVFGLP